MWCVVCNASQPSARACAAWPSRSTPSHPRTGQQGRPWGPWVHATAQACPSGPEPGVLQQRVPGGGQAGEDTAAADRTAGVLPLAALDDRLAIVGTSGSGKTYAAKGLAERLMAGGWRVCIVDPLGVWWGLRSSAHGCAPSPFPVVVFGGPHADVALDPGMGTSLGALVGTGALTCVVDVSNLGSTSVRRSFMTAFTAALYEANTEPLHLVLDDADL